MTKKTGTDASKPFLETAPWLIAVFAERYGIDEKGARQKHYYVPESVGIATGFLINAFHQLYRYAHPYTKSDEIFESDSRASEQRAALCVVGRRAPVPDSDGAARGHRQKTPRADRHFYMRRQRPLLFLLTED